MRLDCGYELIDLVEMETRELLSEYDFPGDDIPVIRGSALGALEGDAKWMDAIRELMKPSTSTSRRLLVTTTSRS